ncbi:DUF3530 family protein [Pseudomonas matsuisoli]|uniref:DUF3530 domain-containing protein n=1 Tax=Pseudomonas matsuisoli TaxID=1515666 RepID=A0A917PZL4_9PSED|nr:DUF3530 family protein [Pseudomonas matsuisoli]GGK02067.1 hypothetical protein GCM10009304_29800 [Pseudomonas matsuisoli]
MPVVSRSLFVLLLASATVFAQTSPPESPGAEKPADVPLRAALPERSEQEAAALAARLPTEQQRMLEADGASFLALWLPANRDTVKGTAIIIPGTNETADWPRVVGPLRRSLPDASWQTLSLTLPDALDTLSGYTIGTAPSPLSSEQTPSAEKPETPVEEAPAADAPQATPETTDSERQDAHAKRVLSRIQAAVDEATKTQPADVVLIGNGTGAYWAARFASEQAPDALRHVVLVDAAVPAGFSPDLESLAPGLKAGVADMVTSTAPDDRALAEKRLQASKRLKHPNYQQMRLDGLSSDRDTAQTQIARRIRGWLERQ